MMVGMDNLILEARTLTSECRINQKWEMGNGK